MKVKIDFWQVVVTSYYGVDKMVLTDIKTYTDYNKTVESAKRWLQDTSYATQPEYEDGTFKGRTFDFKRFVNLEGAGGTIERVTDVPEEYFFRRVEVFADDVTKDIPLVFDIKDITKIRLFTKDDEKEAMQDTKKATEPQVLDMIDDEVYRTRIWDSKIQDCANKTRAANALKAYDILTIGELLEHTPVELRLLPHMGVKCVEFLQRELREKYNINWY